MEKRTYRGHGRVLTVSGPSAAVLQRRCRYEHDTAFTGPDPADNHSRNGIHGPARAGVGDPYEFRPRGSRADGIGAAVPRPPRWPAVLADHRRSCRRTE